MQIFWQPRIRGWSVNSEALNENSHKYDKGDAKQQHGPPELSHPLDNGEEGLLVEEQVLEPDQRALGVHLAALEEHVAVALEVVARRPRPQAQALFQALQFTPRHQVRGGHAGVVVAGALARQLA